MNEILIPYETLHTLVRLFFVETALLRKSIRAYRKHLDILKVRE